jgi:hypothetical protein
MNELAAVSARAPRAALLLFTSLALVSAPAFAQTPPPAVATPVLAAPVGSVKAPDVAPSASTQGNQAVVLIAPPAVPVVVPISTLRPSGNALAAPSLGETAITLDVSTGIRTVPPARITVPAGETLLVTGPNFSGRPAQWLKDGRPITGATGPLLAVQNVRATDAGIYQLVPAETSSSSAPSQFLVLGVGPTDRLVNLSIRGTLAAGPGQNFTAGFVVNGGASQTKKLILRAIGPTLASFGVPSPLRAPVLRIYDSSGNIYSNGYAYLPVVGGLTYEADLAGSLASTGAFPVAAGTLDAVVMMPFLPGAYTAQVTSGDNTAGTVLLEIYEVP